MSREQSEKRGFWPFLPWGALQTEKVAMSKGMIPPHLREILFALTKHGDHTASDRLVVEGTRRIRALLGRKYRRLMVPWEIEEVADAAFAETAIRFDNFEVWPQALAFAKQRAIWLSWKCIRRKKMLPREEAMPDVLDPSSGSSARRIEARDTILNIVRTLKPSTECTPLFEARLNDIETIDDLRRFLGWSVRTMRRHLVLLRNTYCL